MATVKIKNRKDHPLALELGTSGLHLQALETREVDEEVLKSEQVQAAIASGYLKVTPVANGDPDEGKGKKGSEK